MEHFYEQFGRRLRRERDGAELSQAEVASRVGLTRTSIANIESGKQRVALHRFVDLAAAIGCDPMALLMESTEDQLSDVQMLAAESADEELWLRRIASKSQVSENAL